MNESLFENDKVYQEAEEAASYMEKVNKTLLFLGFNIEVACCLNCKFRDEGKCHVMKDYNGVIFETSPYAKCKHHKKAITA